MVVEKFKILECEIEKVPSLKNIIYTSPSSAPVRKWVVAADSA